jgi:hypothetical protein
VGTAIDTMDLTLIPNASIRTGTRTDPDAISLSPGRQVDFLRTAGKVAGANPGESSAALTYRELYAALVASMYISRHMGRQISVIIGIYRRSRRGFWVRGQVDFLRTAGKVAGANPGEASAALTYRELYAALVAYDEELAGADKKVFEELKALEYMEVGRVVVMAMTVRFSGTVLIGESTFGVFPGVEGAPPVAQGRRRDPAVLAAA